ncbi:MAG: hypothetical protein AABX32_05345 [Nanoarchaeota archaeon]|mgnify:CR=1 FL=1
MVKIKAKILLMSVLVMLFLMSSAYAATNKLIIDDVDVKVGSRTSNNLRNGDTIREEAKPGDSLEIKVTMKNNYTSSDNMRIEDITVKTTVESIDDGDDLEEESSTFSLSSGSTKKITLKFKVPLEVDESTYDILIEADGSDRNGTSQDAQMTIRLDVNKQTHDIKVTKLDLVPSEVACTRKNIRLNLGILNLGTEDEETVNLEISNSDLGIDIKDQVIDLIAEANSDESRYSKTYTFSVSNSVEAGTYPIDVSVLYNDDRKRTVGTVQLAVSDCPTATTESTQNTQTTTQTTQTTTTPTSTTTTQTTGNVDLTKLPYGTTVTQESFFKSNAFVIGIIIAEIIAVIVGIILIVALFVRRD